MGVPGWPELACCTASIARLLKQLMTCSSPRRFSWQQPSPSQKRLTTRLVLGFVLLGLAEDHILAEVQYEGGTELSTSIVRALRSAIGPCPNAGTLTAAALGAHSKALYKAPRHGPWALEVLKASPDHVEVSISRSSQL